MAISRFAASEKLTAMAMGLTYIMSPFSTLYDHVKDVAIGVSTWPLLPISSPTMPPQLNPVPSWMVVPMVVWQVTMFASFQRLASTRPTLLVFGESLLKNLSLVTAIGLVFTHLGPSIVFLNQYANYGKGHAIHSKGQLRAFGILVHEAPCASGGKQRIITPDGCCPAVLVSHIWI